MLLRQLKKQVALLGCLLFKYPWAVGSSAAKVSFSEDPDDATGITKTGCFGASSGYPWSVFWMFFFVFGYFFFSMAFLKCLLNRSFLESQGT